VTDTLARPRPPAPSRYFRVGALWRHRMAPLVLGFAALALIAVFTNAAGRYIPDNHTDLAFSPGRLLAGQAVLWNGAKGLGRADEQAWVVASLFFALVRGLGASPAVAERLFHAAVLTAAGAGMVALLRSFRPRVATEHLIAGLFYMFNPFTVIWMIPSLLLVPYALAPWFAVVFLRGVRDQRPWRWAAAFALLAFVDDTVDVPGLVFALLPLMLVAVYVVHVERSATWRTVFAWVVRAGLLTVGVFAAVMVRYVAGQSSLAQRLGTTETPRGLNPTSSWSETWRGLGFWLLYLRNGGGLLRPGTAAYFTSPAMILATFVAPVTAVLTFWRSRWRPRLLFAAIAVLGLLLMVGSYPPADPSPYGRLLLRGYDRFFFLWGWRNNYKAGPGWAMGVSALLGVGVAALALRNRRPWMRMVIIGGAVAVVFVASFPFWTNRLYSTPQTFRNSRPAYWAAANRWLERRHDEGRVLVLPGTFTPVYSWGNIGTDAVELDNPFLMNRFFATESAEAANLLAAIDQTIRDGTSPGSIAPIARRLGVRYLVLQNDLDRRVLGVPRPADLRPIRLDHSIQRVATFGRKGQNVVDPKDRSFGALYEATIPPVEIYRVPDPVPDPRVRAGAPLVVSGDGTAWPSLATDGRLDAAGPVLYSASSSSADLAKALDAGGEVVVSDTNRRRLTVATGAGAQSSYTLGPGQDLDRAANALFADNQAQSVAVFRDGSRVSASGYGGVFSGPQPWLRPANAFDGDPRTAWQTGGFGSGAGEWLQVDLTRSRLVSRLQITDSPGPVFARYVAKATVMFSDGSHVTARLPQGHASLRFRPRRTNWIKIHIDELGGKGQNPVGFADITVPGLRLGEQIRLPEDLFAKAEQQPALAEALARTPITYQFDRSRSIDLHDEELVLHRQLRSDVKRSFDVAGTLRIWASTPDEVLAALIGGPRSAFGSSRAGGLEGRGGMAIDGDVSTSWNGNALRRERLTTRFPTRPVTTVDISVVADDKHSKVSELRVTAGSQSVRVPVPAAACAAGTECVVPVTARFTPVPVGEIVVEVTKVEPVQSGFGPLPVGIAEVGLDGQPGTPDDPNRLLEGCFGYLLQVDGQEVPVELHATPESLLDQSPAVITSCAPVTLDRGRHDVDGSGAVLIDHLGLTSGPLTQGPQPQRTASVERVTQTEVRLRTDGRSGTAVLTGQSYDPGWRAVADGVDLGPPQSMDTQSGWFLPPGTKTVRMDYAPQQTYRKALAISITSIVFCAWLLLRRSRRDPAPGAADDGGG
jgi:arabinofuranan 3-O-arabinosyltransferase